MLAALLILATIPDDAHRVVYVDRAELNHVMVCKDGQWRQSLCQWILWDYDGVRGCYVVVAWALAKDCGGATRIAGEWRLLFRRRTGGETVIVSPACVQETWSVGDPEVENRDVLPSGRRRGVR